MFSLHKGKGEKAYEESLKGLEDKVVIAPPGADVEGFERFFSEEFALEHPEMKPSIRKKVFAQGFTTARKMAKVFVMSVPSIMGNRVRSFTETKPYIEELRTKGEIEHDHQMEQSYPNTALWKELTKYAWDKHGVLVGFTEVPEQLVFKGKSILFRYALVCIQEMRKEMIDDAPGLNAGEEAFRVYNSLGIAVNDIANWLRDNHNIKCQANHPLGGLVNTPPLAGKAGMGWQGQNGLVITPQFGQRHRIAPIFIDQKLFEFTDNQDHRWIEDFCQTCMRCQRECPVGAIYEERRVKQENVPGIGQTKTCIDNDVCFPQFNKTLGCSVCIKVCPFSNVTPENPDVYERIKKSSKQKRAEYLANKQG